MTSFHVICGLGLPWSKILGTPMNWRSPEKNFWRPFFFRRTLAPVFLVLGLGLEHSCPWPREVLSSERLSLASVFFVSLALASSLVSSTPPLVIMHTTVINNNIDNNEGAPGPLTNVQGAPAHCRQPWGSRAPNWQLGGFGVPNWQPGAPRAPNQQPEGPKPTTSSP